MKKVLFVFLYLLVACDSNFHEGLLYDLFGNHIKFKVLCSTDDFSVGGEGIAMSVYDVEETSLLKILNSNLESFPKRGEYRKKWNVLNWTEGPIKNEDMMILKYCLEGLDSSCMKYFNTKELVTEKILYSSFYLDDKTDPYYAEFFILVPKKNKLIVMSKKV